MFINDDKKTIIKITTRIQSENDQKNLKNTEYRTHRNIKINTRQNIVKGKNTKGR